LDPAVLAGFSYSNIITQLLKQPNAKGVLEALAAAVESRKNFNGNSNNESNTNNNSPANNISAASLALQWSNWSDEVSAAMHDFVLDHVLAKLESLTAAEVDILVALPIWPSFDDGPVLTTVYLTKSTISVNLSYK
jgi:hypothetical protein